MNLVCPECGEFQNQPKASSGSTVHCPKCSAKFIARPAKECLQCRTQNPGQAAFCRNCHYEFPLNPGAIRNRMTLTGALMHEDRTQAAFARTSYLMRGLLRVWSFWNLFKLLPGTLVFIFLWILSGLNAGMLMVLGIWLALCTPLFLTATGFLQALRVGQRLEKGLFASLSILLILGFDALRAVVLVALAGILHSTPVLCLAIMHILVWWIEYKGARLYFGRDF